MSQPSEQPHTLPRVLGLLDAIMIVVGSVIGSGVFFKAKTIAAALPGSEGMPGFVPIISVWIVVGLVTLCGTLALAELAAMLPHAGGPYVYLREAFGRLPAFLWGWTEFWIIRTASIGALATASVMSLNRFLVLSGKAELSHWTQAEIAAAIVIGLAAINVLGTRWGAGVQNVLTFIKVGFLFAVILLPWLTAKASLGLLSGVGEQPENYSFWGGYAASVIAVMWAYDGWINLSPVAEEIREPQRNVPLALLFGMLLLILVYVGANLSYHLLLPIGTIAKSEAPAVSAMQVMAGTLGGKIAALVLVCSTFGAVNSNMLTGPRIYFAVARDGLLPKLLHHIHVRWQTPANAILLQTVWTIVLLGGAFAWTRPAAAPSPGDTPVARQTAGSPAKPVARPDPHGAFDKLTNYAIFGGSAFYAMAVAAVFVLRKKRPDLPRPYRTWGYPWTPAIYLVAFAGALASLLAQCFSESVLGSVVIAAGVVYYLAVTRRRTARSA